MNNIIDEKVLIFTEVGKNSNKYYKLQLFDNGKVLVTYGRVGVTKQVNEFSGGKLFFDKQIRSKQKKGYVEAKVVGQSSGSEVKLQNSELSNLAKKQIVKNSNPILENLIDRFVKANIHIITSNTNISYSPDTGLFSTPLGIITSDAITEARGILLKIKDFISKKQYSNKDFLLCVNNYLSIIPTNVGMKLRPEILFPDETSIQKQNSILDSLDASYISLQNKPVNNGDVKEEKVFEIDCDILNDGTEKQRIIKLYEQTLNRSHACSSLKVKQIFTIDIKENTRDFQNKGEKIGNIMELFHGSKVSNLLSIFKKGLIIPPVNANYITGRAYGNGIYASNQSSKAANYSYGYWSGTRDPNCFLFVVKFAMGKVYTPHTSGRGYYGSESLPKEGYDSTWAKGGTSGVINDEMIVYNTYQAKITHLIEIG